MIAIHEEDCLEHHAQNHKFQYCAQEVFTTEAQFVEHLVAEHGARRICFELAEIKCHDGHPEMMDIMQQPGTMSLSDSFQYKGLESWESLQYVERLDGVPLIRSPRLFEERLFNESSLPKHVVSVLDGTDTVNDHTGLKAFLVGFPRLISLVPRPFSARPPISRSNGRSKFHTTPNIKIISCGLWNVSPHLTPPPRFSETLKMIPRHSPRRHFFPPYNLK